MPFVNTPNLQGQEKAGLKSHWFLLGCPLAGLGYFSSCHDISNVFGTSLAAQWLGLCSSTEGATV